MKWKHPTVCGVSGLIALTAQESQAAIVTSDVENQPISGTYDFDIDGNSVIDFQLLVGQGMAIYGAGSNTIFGDSSANYYSRGDAIQFSDNSTSSTGLQYPSAGSSYFLGLKFERDGNFHAEDRRAGRGESVSGRVQDLFRCGVYSMRAAAFAGPLPFERILRAA